MSSEDKPKKTWKRETAWALILVLVYAIYSGNPEILKVIIWPFMLFIGAAFGMDWVSKQTNIAGR